MDVQLPELGKYKLLLFKPLRMYCFVKAALVNSRRQVPQKKDALGETTRVAKMGTFRCDDRLKALRGRNGIV